MTPKQTAPESFSQLQKLDLRSQDIAQEKREGLARLFPEVRTEGGKIDFERLKLALGETIDVGKERYGLNWPGKAQCFSTIQRPSLGTLRPCREESVSFDGTSNIFIEGDNLEALKLLQKSYLGKVKLIYIDPPYNTGNDFIYPDNYTESLQTYLEYTGQVDAEGRRFGTNTESDGRFHSKWLSMMYPRLYLARNLLRDDGAIAISIGEDELGNLLHLCDEVFGEENLISICSRVMKTGGQKGAYFSPCVDYIVIFAKDIESLDPFREQIGQNLIDKVYTKTAEDGPRKGEKYRSMGLYQAMLDKRANQRFYIECPDGELVIPPGESFPSEAKEGAQVAPTDGDGVWRWTYPRYAKEKDLNNIEFIKSDKTSLVKRDGSKASWNVYYRIWLKDRLEDGQLPGNILEKFESRHSSAELKVLGIPFDFAKPTALIKFLMSVCGVKEGDLTLDFFAGSGSTGHAAIELSLETGQARPFICIQLPEATQEGSEERKAGFGTISDIAKERIRRAGKMLQERLVGQPGDVGFRVFKLAESNFKPWNADVGHERAELEKQMEMQVDHIGKDRTPEDILCEILLKSGFPLSTPLDTISIAGKSVFSVAGGALLVCLERDLTLEVIRAMADRKPERIVCLDAGFASNDQLKANAVQTFRTKGITSFKTV
jgi:adenine-specific DNA-methyltransferase